MKLVYALYYIALISAIATWLGTLFYQIRHHSTTSMDVLFETWPWWAIGVGVATVALVVADFLERGGGLGT